MMDFDSQLAAELHALAEQGLHRHLRRIDSPQSCHIRVDARDLLNFSSNDYLGLANQPVIKEAAQKAVLEYGAGSGASRLICGSLAPHHALEDLLARFKQTEAALTFSSGYAAALGAIGTLVSRDDLVILDHLVHACLVDATRLSGAKIRVFAHNDLDKLEAILRWARTPRSPTAAVAPARFRRILVITESIFSMDGDQAPLRNLVELKEKHGAWLMVDEAHATGLYGPARRGLAEALGVSDRIEVHMGTLGKALGSSGGYICGSQKLIELLINRARSFIFSTAPVPAAAAAAAAAVQFVQQPCGAAQRDVLWDRVEQLLLGFKRLLAAPAGLSEPVRRAVSSFMENAHSMALPSAIIPLVAGSESQALQLAQALRERDMYAPAIRYPTVPRGRARLRLTLTASHRPDDVEALLRVLSELACETRSGDRGS